MFKRLMFWKRPSRCQHGMVNRVRSGWGYQCLTCKQPIRMVSLYLTGPEQVHIIRDGWKIK